MGWASRRNPIAVEAKAGGLAPRVYKTFTTKREDEWLAKWWTMWDRVHGILVDIQPRVNPHRKDAA